jgi:hypothetical protein
MSALQHQCIFFENMKNDNIPMIDIGLYGFWTHHKTLLSPRGNDFDLDLSPSGAKLSPLKSVVLGERSDLLTVSPASKAFLYLESASRCLHPSGTD